MRASSNRSLARDKTYVTGKEQILNAISIEYGRVNDTLLAYLVCFSFLVRLNSTTRLNPWMIESPQYTGSEKVIIAINLSRGGLIRAGTPVCNNVNAASSTIFRSQVLQTERVV
jgi:hypothetical protein